MSAIQCTTSPLAGLYQATQMARVYYGTGSVSQHLVSCLPSATSRAFIVTGSSLARKTPLVKQVEQLLGTARHAGTFSQISQHAPLSQIDAATTQVRQDARIDTVISIGGGSPIDAAKVVSSRTHELTGSFLQHIAIPTTLSVAECTMIAGYTEQDGTKALVKGPELVPTAVLYDAGFAAHTPPQLMMTTAIRALDHAVELLYNPYAAEAPTKALCLQAMAVLFAELPRYKNDPRDENTITKLQLACFGSLYGLGLNVGGPLGLSHTLGYAIGSPYGVPHGVTSCLTLAPVVRLKADTDPDAAAQIARALPFVAAGRERHGEPRADALRVADAIADLVRELGLATTLTERNVNRDQAGVITERATKQKEGKLFDAVKQLVDSLY